MSHSRSFRNIDIDKISYSKLDDYTQITYLNKKLQFWTPVMFCPFGIEKSYNNYVLKLSFVNKVDGEKVLQNDFLNFVKSIEEKNMEYLDVDNTVYNTQIFKKEGYDPMLIIKIPFNNDRFQAEFKDRNEDAIVSGDVKKSQNLQVLIEIDNLWLFNDKYTCKFKAKIVKLA